MIEPEHPRISTARQCRLLGLPRSSYYHRPKPAPAGDLQLMRRIDEIYLAHPYFGSRQMARFLRRQGYPVNRKRIQRLMRLMDMEAIYQKPNLSRPHPEHRVYPYLLRRLKVTRPNQVFACDITYVPIEGGFLYLCAVIDWYSRAVLAWGLSNTLDATFCVEAVGRAIEHYGIPEIFNTDQGSQFTSAEFTEPLLALGIKISMDGKGRALDNVFVERLWRTVKWDEIYRKSYRSQIDAEVNLGRFFRFYNEDRPHSAFPGDVTPLEVYHRDLPAVALSA
jgi:putative transposase